MIGGKDFVIREGLAYFRWRSSIVAWRDSGLILSRSGPVVTRANIFFISIQNSYISTIELHNTTGTIT